MEIWKVLMRSQFFKWKRLNLKTNQDEFHLVQGALRPSILGAWEYVFPEEALSDVLSMMGIVDNTSYGFKGFGLKSRHLVLRKLFGAKPIPKDILKKVKDIPHSILLNNSWRAVGDCRTPGVAIHVIGIKKDERRKLLDRIANVWRMQECL